MEMLVIQVHYMSQPYSNNLNNIFKIIDKLYSILYLGRTVMLWGEFYFG